MRQYTFESYTTTHFPGCNKKSTGQALRNTIERMAVNMVYALGE